VGKEPLKYEDCIAPLFTGLKVIRGGSLKASTALMLTMWWHHENAKLNPFSRLLALLGAHHILHLGGVRVNCYVN
jgi:hypothetical protein